MKQFFDSILYIPGLLEILKEIPVNCTNFKGKHYKKQQYKKIEVPLQMADCKQNKIQEEEMRNEIEDN